MSEDSKNHQPDEKKSTGSPSDTEEKSGFLSSRKMIKTASCYNVIQKTMEALASSSAYDKIMEQMKDARSFQKAMEALADSSAYARLMEQMKDARSLQKAMESLTDSSAYARSMEQMKDVRSVQKTLEALTASSAYAKVIEKIFTCSSLQLELERIIGTDSFRSAMEVFVGTASFQASVSASDLQSTELFGVESHIDEQLDSLVKANGPAEFAQVFSEIPVLLQVFILSIFLHIVLPIINNITANMVTPHVETIIRGAESSKRDLIKEIAATKIEDVDLSQHRFVTAEVLHLRQRPTINSAILDQLALGRVLTVVSREGNWMEVTYSYDDGRIMRGWVFARYTAKFRR